MNSSKVAVRGATLLVVVPSRGWSGFTSAPDLLAVRESMNVCLTSGLTIRMDASTTFCGHIPITPRFWGVGHLRPLPPATDHATKCSRTIVSELIGSVNTSVFLVTYLVRLPTTGLVARENFRVGRDSGAIPRRVDDRLRTKSLLRVTDSTSIST